MNRLISRRGRPAPAGEDGFTLIEAMAAFVVAVIGLLALLFSVEYAIRGNTQTHRRTTADLAVQGMRDRILTAGTAGGIPGLTSASYLGIDTTALAPCPTGALPPLVASRVGDDCLQWQQELTLGIFPQHRSLPGARGTVTMNTLGDVQVTVSWQGLFRTHQVTMLVGL